MKSPILLLAFLLSAAGAAQAQDQTPARPSQGPGGRGMESCKQDTQKFCSASSPTMQQQCLVLNWNKISGDCQNAIARPSRGIGDG